jgi:hypothetical protein
MRSLDAVRQHILEFVPANHGTYELLSGDEVGAVVRMAGRTFAVIETAEARWILRYEGITCPTIVVYNAAVPKGPPHRELRRDPQHVWTLPAINGSTLRWRRASLTAPHWACSDEAGQVLIDLLDAPRLAGADWRPGCTQVRLARSLRHLPGLSLALAVGWFLFYVHQSGELSLGEG